MAGDIPSGPNAADLALQFRLQAAASGGGNPGIQYTGSQWSNNMINQGAQTLAANVPHGSLTLRGVLPSGSGRGFFGNLFAGVFAAPNPLAPEHMTAGIQHYPVEHLDVVPSGGFSSGLGGGSFVAQVGPSTHHDTMEI